MKDLCAWLTTRVGVHEMTKFREMLNHVLILTWGQMGAGLVSEHGSEQ
jgi:hypothetical protein